MPQKTQWASVAHDEKMRLLGKTAPAVLVKTYTHDGMSDDEFRAELERDIQLWDPKNIAKVREVDEVPTKDIVLGAWRDLDRSEAIMELIDNSVDAWNRRRREYPKKVSKTLTISIDIDSKNGHLVYEDNAGGVPTNKLANLVVPGYSDTDDFSRTIGSYKTGGKKAVFRLACAAMIVTRHWDPEEKVDEAVAVQLTSEWIDDSQQYKFPYAILKDSSTIPKGATRYVLQLRKEDIDPDPWYQLPDQLGRVTRQITNAYTLLIIRNPDIQISFRKKPIAPNESLYDFSGTAKDETDISPQMVVFETALEYKGGKHAMEIEIVLGCRTTTGVKDGKAGGIDLYGNDRLFVSHDQEVFTDLLPTGNSRNLVRGFINIKAPNIFIPWDTHKRHLNADREIVRLLTKSKAIVTLFDNWKKAYRAISSLGTGEVSKVIGTALDPLIDKKKKDLAIRHKSTVELEIVSGVGSPLPKTVHVPVVKTQKRKNDGLKITIAVTPDDARRVMAYYKLKGEPTQATMKELADLIKEELMEWVEGAKHE